MRHLYFLLLCIGTLLPGCAIKPKSVNTFSFAVIGDMQYNAREELLFPQLIDALNREDLAFVAHVGDFKAGSNAPCTDALYLRRREEFNASRHAFVYTPGDNEWVDCRRPSNGGADPLQRLAKLREVFFATPASLGKNPIALLRQPAAFSSDPALWPYKENAMWNGGGVIFATLNVQGSNDNVGFDAASDQEQVVRTRANVAWLRLAARKVHEEGAIALVLFLQANPGFEDDGDVVAKSGYREFLTAFEAEATALAKPVLFVHGDSHRYRVDRPYLSPLDKRPITNVTRLEVWGTPFVNWVRVTVDRDNPAAPFTIESGGFTPRDNAP